jgi:hypothetical protein
MAKRTSLTLRKPSASKPVDPTVLEAFVGGGASEPVQAVVTPIRSEPTEPAPAPLPTPKASAPAQAAPAPKAPAKVKPAGPRLVEDEVPTFRRASKAISKRKTKADRRRTTVYMQLDVARELAEYCGQHDTEMSEVVNQAVREFLEA